MKFLHAADVHLDSAMRGLDKYPGAPADAVRGATRRALANLVDLCLAEDVDALLIAGDLYDGNWKDYNTGLYFAAQMSRLRAAAVPVVMIRGNHDAASQIAKSLRLPDHVRELSWQKAETVVLSARRGGEVDIAVHGQSFKERAVIADLAAQYPTPHPGAFNVGLLHTSLEGREGHDTYAPTTAAVLASKGYDYWALGHVHAREIVARDPWIVFPGNLQGRYARETGAKGATLVVVEDGRVAQVEHRALDVARWCVCEVDAGDASGAEDVVDLARRALEAEVARAEGRVVAARLVVRGATRAHLALEAQPDRWLSEIRAAATDVGGGEGVWVERVVLETHAPIDLDALAKRDDAIGQLLRSLRAAKDDDEELSALFEELKDLRHKLPLELREGADAIRIDSPRDLAPLLDDVGALLLPRLLGSGEGDR